MVDKNGKVHTGGRRRAVLKEFLGDAEIKSLQSDGYSILSSRPVSRSVATSATSSLTMFGSGTGDEGTMTI